MDNIIKNETIGCLQSFEGFYDSIWEPDMDIYYECERTGKEEYVDFTFDDQEYRQDICKDYTQVWEFWMREFISDDIQLEFLKVVSPQYYTAWDTDRCRVKIKLTQAAEDAIIAKIEQHHELLAQWIKENHTSRDGFISYLSNDIDQWPSRLFDDNEIRQPAYLFYMLYYIVKAEFIRVGVNVDLEHEAYGCICEGIDITAYMQEVEVMA